MTTDPITIDIERPKNIPGSCVHYWIIDEPEGPISQGVCRICGAQREFSNVFDPDSRKPPGSL